MFASIICAFVGSGGKKNVCKSCARKAVVQTLCKPNSPRNLCKPCAKILARAGLWHVRAIVVRAWEGRGSVRDSKRASTIGFAGGLGHGQERRESIQVNRMHPRP